MADKYKLSYSDELKINDIFKVKGWKIDNANKNSLFNRFRERCQELNDEERDLFYKLTLDFKWVSLNEYIQLLSELLSKVVTKYIDSAQHIYIYPKKKEEDHEVQMLFHTFVEQLKSNTLTYLAKKFQNNNHTR